MIGSCEDDAQISKFSSKCIIKNPMTVGIPMTSIHGIPHTHSTKIVVKCFELLSLWACMLNANVYYDLMRLMMFITHLGNL